MRLLQQRKITDISLCKDLPEEIPLPLVIGTKVTGEWELTIWQAARIRVVQLYLYLGYPLIPSTQFWLVGRRWLIFCNRSSDSSASVKKKKNSQIYINTLVRRCSRFYGNGLHRERVGLMFTEWLFSVDVLSPISFEIQHQWSQELVLFFYTYIWRVNENFLQFPVV